MSKRIVKSVMACQEGGGSVVQTVGALRGSGGSTGSSCGRSGRPGGQLESPGPEQWQGQGQEAVGAGGMVQKQSPQKGGGLEV